MSLATRYHLRALRFTDPGSVGAFNLTHLENFSADRNLTEIRQASAGDFADCFIGLSGTDPTISFDTTQIREYLLMMRNSDAADGRIITDLSAGNVQLAYAAGKQNGLRIADATPAHMIATMTNNAATYWSSLSVRQEEKATISAMIKTSDTTPGVAALSYAGGQALTGLATACGSIYTLGPVFFNGTQLEGVTAVDWSNNVQEINLKADGEPSTCYFGIQRFAPEIRISTANVAELYRAAIAGGGHEPLSDTISAGVSIYLKKIAKTNFFVPNATPEHIRLFGNVGLRITNPLSGDVGETTVRCLLEKDGDGAFGVDIDVAITT